jgi:TrmH family RNA methyltransferase
MLLDGTHLVSDAIRAGIELQYVAVTPASSARGDIGELMAVLERKHIKVHIVSESVMDAISPVRSSSGIAAVAERPAAATEQLYAGIIPLVVIAVEVQDPGNVGAMVRVAEAAGATGLITTGGSANPFGWKALRGSMGSALRLPIACGLPVDAAIDDARRHGCQVVAAVPRGGRSIFESDLTGPIAILIGGEGRGLPPALVDAADERVTIPMLSPVESLNAAVTAALIIYESLRQRIART